MTFSLVACDPERREWGVAVASRFLAVGAVVPFAAAEVGALATQAAANVRFGPDGLRLLTEGSSAEATLRRLIGGDDGRDERQLGVVDRLGRSATYTGSGCFECDRRGQQSAALFVVAEEGGYGGGTDRLGHASGALTADLESWAGVENLEERVSGAGPIDPVVLGELRAATGPRAGR